MGAVGQAHRTGGPADFFHRDDVRQVAELGTAELALDRDAEQPEFAELRPEVTRKLVVLVDGRRAGRDAIGCEAAHGLAQQVQVLAMTKIKFEHWFATPVDSYRDASILRAVPRTMNTYCVVVR